MDYTGIFIHHWHHTGSNVQTFPICAQLNLGQDNGSLFKNESRYAELKLYR